MAKPTKDEVYSKQEKLAHLVHQLEELIGPKDSEAAMSLYWQLADVYQQACALVGGDKDMALRNRVRVRMLYRDPIYVEEALANFIYAQGVRDARNG